MAESEHSDWSLGQLDRLTKAPTALLNLLWITGFDLRLRPETEIETEPDVDVDTDIHDEADDEHPSLRYCAAVPQFEKMSGPKWALAALHAFVLWPLLIGRSILVILNVRLSKLNERNMTENSLLVQGEYHAASHIAIYLFLAVQSRAIARLLRETLAVITTHGDRHSGRGTSNFGEDHEHIVLKLRLVSRVFCVATIAYALLQLKIHFLMELDVESPEDVVATGSLSSLFWKSLQVALQLYALYGAVTMLLVKLTFCLQLVILDCHLDLFLMSAHADVHQSSTWTATTTTLTELSELRLLRKRQDRHREIGTLVNQANRVFGVATLIWVCDFAFTTIFQLRSVVNAQYDSDVIFGSRFHIVVRLVLNSLVFIGVCCLIIKTNSKLTDSLVHVHDVNTGQPEGGFKARPTRVINKELFTARTNSQLYCTRIMISAPRISAFGFFDINKNFLMAVSGTVVTYVLLLYDK